MAVSVFKKAQSSARVKSVRKRIAANKQAAKKLSREYKAALKVALKGLKKRGTGTKKKTVKRKRR